VKKGVSIKNLIIKFWPFGFIFLIWFIFASPYFLKGKIPYPSTYHVNNFAPFSAYPQFASPVKNAATPDIVTQIYPWKHFTVETWNLGQVPFWNPYSFSGTPHLANYQSAVLSPFNLVFFIMPFVDGWSLLVLLQPLLAGVFIYLFLRSLNVTKFGSVVSSISFMFCGFIVTWMGYATLGYAILFLPLSLFAIEKFYQSARKKYLVLLALTIPLSFFSGHFQISLYFLFFILIYLVYSFVRTKNIYKASFVLLYIISGICVSFAQILPSLEFYSQSVRSGLFQKLEAIPLTYFPTFLAPDFFGNPTTRNDWFGHYAEWNGYIGVLGFMLAVYSLMGKRTKHVYFLFLSGIVVIGLAFSTPLLDFFISIHFPVIATSAASRIIVLYSFIFSVLSGIGIDALYTDIKEQRIKRITLWLSVFFVLFTGLWVIILTKRFLPFDKIVIAKQNVLLPSFLFMFVAFVVYTGVILRKKRTSLAFVFAVLLFLLSFDMLRFANKWQAFDPRELIFPKVPVANYFEKISGYERSYGNYSTDALIYYHLPSLDGYDPLYISRYGEFVTAVNTGKVGPGYRSVVSFQKKGVFTQKALNLLNIRYIIQKASDENQPWGFPFSDYPKSQFNLIYKDVSYHIYENTRVFPHAFVPSDYKIIKSPQKIIDVMFADSTNLRNTVILEENPQVLTGFKNPGVARVTSYTSNYLTIVANMTEGGLVFLSDTYYPGWNATIDGKKTHIFRADYAFRAVSVPKGKHFVQFYFLPNSFIIGLGVSIFGLLLFMILIIVPVKLKNTSKNMRKSWSRNGYLPKRNGR